MSVSFDDIENAFLFVSMEQKFMHNAYLCKETGQIFYTSQFGYADELPDDIDDPKKYIAIPHQNELELGKLLIFEYVSKYLPSEFDHVQSIFKKRGAYSRFKNLLHKKSHLDKWYKFEDERRKSVLKLWCQENNIELKS